MITVFYTVSKGKMRLRRNLSTTKDGFCVRPVATAVITPISTVTASETALAYFTTGALWFPQLYVSWLVNIIEENCIIERASATCTH